MGISRWFVATAFVVVVVHGGHVAIAADDEVVLGATLPLTGEHRHIGEYTKNGYGLAIQRINKRGGVVVGDGSYRLVARYYDDKSNPVLAQELIDRMIGKDGVKFILGPYQAHRYRGVLTSVERNRVPTVAGHTVARKRGGSGGTFSFAVGAMPDRYFAPTLEFVQALSQRFGKSSEELRIGMATENEPFSREVRAGVLSDVQRLGIACIIDDQVPESFDDISATLDRVKKLKPDVFLVSGQDAMVASAVNQIEESGASVPLVAVTRCETARLAKESPNSSNYVFCPVQWDRSARHEGELFGTAEQFATLYEKTFGHEPTSAAAQAAAAVYVFADAFTRAQSFETEDVRDAISATNLETFFGPIKFDAQGINSKKSVLLTQIIDGDYVLIAPQGWAEREPVITKQAP